MPPTPGTAPGRDRPAAATGNARPRSRRAQAAQQPLQTLGGQHHRRPAGHRDLGGRAVADKQVAALPLRGDPGIRRRLQPGAQDRLVQLSAYRYSVLHSCEASQCFDSRQITASQRVLAC